MVWKYQKFYYGKKLKTSEKLLKIPDWNQPYWMTRYDYTYGLSRILVVGLALWTNAMLFWIMNLSLNLIPVGYWASNCQHSVDGDDHCSENRNPQCTLVNFWGARGHLPQDPEVSKISFWVVSRSKTTSQGDLPSKLFISAISMIFCAFSIFLNPGGCYLTKKGTF